MRRIQEERQLADQQMAPDALLEAVVEWPDLQRSLHHPPVRLDRRELPVHPGDLLHGKRRVGLQDPPAGPLPTERHLLLRSRPEALDRRLVQAHVEQIEQETLPSLHDEVAKALPELHRVEEVLGRHGLTERVLPGLGYRVLGRGLGRYGRRCPRAMTSRSGERLHQLGSPPSSASVMDLHTGCGLEPWRRVHGLELTRWDLWSLTVRVKEGGGSWDRLANRLRDPKERKYPSLFDSQDWEAKRSHMEHLRVTLESTHLDPVRLLGPLVDVRSALILYKTREKRFKTEVPRGYETAAIMDTPRHRLEARAMRGAGESFPPTPVRLSRSSRTRSGAATTTGRWRSSAWSSGWRAG